jgi:hypothetical protein
MSKHTDNMPAKLHDSYKDLDGIHSRLMKQAALMKQGAGDICAIEKLLNMTSPVTEADRCLFHTIRFLSSRDRASANGRGKLISFLFKTGRECLILLLESAAIPVALGLEDFIEVHSDADGRHRVSLRVRCDAAPASDAAPRRDVLPRREAAPRTGRKRHGRGDRAAVAASGKPVMDMAECQRLLAKIDTARGDGPEEVAAIDEAKAASYLSILTGKGARRPPAEPKAPAAADKKDGAPDSAEIVAAVKASWADMDGDEDDLVFYTIP